MTIMGIKRHLFVLPLVLGVGYVGFADVLDRASNSEDIFDRNVKERANSSSKNTFDGKKHSNIQQKMANEKKNWDKNKSDSGMTPLNGLSQITETQPQKAWDDMSDIEKSYINAKKRVQEDLEMRQSRENRHENFNNYFDARGTADRIKKLEKTIAVNTEIANSQSAPLYERTKAQKKIDQANLELDDVRSEIKNFNMTGRLAYETRLNESKRQSVNMSPEEQVSLLQRYPNLPDSEKERLKMKFNPDKKDNFDDKITNY